jgi:hypothetical protein
MNPIQLIQHGTIWGLIFGTTFCAAMLLLGRINAEILLNDYPPDVRAKFGPMSAETRKQARKATLPLLATLSLVIILGLAQLQNRTGSLTFFDTLLVTTVMLQIWNLMDLIVLDWFILMTLRPRFMILPGTEGLAGYGDYRFHFRKFLNGTVLTLILSGVVTGIALGMEALLELVA